MHVHQGIEHLPATDTGTVLAIGNFDGVHRGHQRIVQTAKQAADELAVPCVVMTFEPHPLVIVAPHRAPARLTTREEKLAILATLGFDAVIVMRSEPELLSRTPLDFLEQVAAVCRPRALVEGSTFNFGRDRTGSVETLREHAGRLGFALHVVDTVYRSDPATGGVNSSAVRAALADGRLPDANAMLGRKYRVAGVVGGGDGRGAPLGFPTANIGAIPHLLPREAVYAAIAQVEGPSFHLAAVNVGKQPTFAQSTSRVEAHLLDFEDDLRGSRVGLHFLARLRDQVRFPGISELIAQLRRDVEDVRELGRQLDEVARGPHVPL